jgi:hypothetical protein
MLGLMHPTHVLGASHRLIRGMRRAAAVEPGGIADGLASSRIKRILSVTHTREAFLPGD